MKAEMMIPIATIRGRIAKGYYARVLYGKQIIQECPKRTKKPTPAQVEARQKFKEKYAYKGHPHNWQRPYDDSGLGNEVVTMKKGNLSTDREKEATNECITIKND